MMIKIAAFVREDGQIAANISDATQVIVVSAEEKIPQDKEVVEIGGEQLTSLLLKLAARNIDVLLAGDVSTQMQSAIRMLGISLYPGCQGDVNDQIAAYLVGDDIGDPDKISIAEVDENDPMNCIHDCSKCMADCATKTDIDLVSKKN